MEQTLAQDHPNRSVQPPHLITCQAAGNPLGMEPRTKEGFIDINVAKTGDQALVEKHALELPRPPRQGRAEFLRGEGPAQRLRPKPTVQPPQVIRQDMQHPAEFALVGESQIGAVSQLDREVLEAQGGSGAGNDFEPAGHPQVNQQRRPVVEIEHQVLRPSPGADEPATDQSRSDRRHTFRPHHPIERRRAQANDEATNHRPQERPPDRLHLGKFWHLAYSTSRGSTPAPDATTNVPRLIW